MIDGRIVFRKTIGGPEDLALDDRTAGTGRAKIMDRFSKIPVQVKAGVRDVVVAFIDRSHVDSSENLRKTGRLRRLDRQPGPHWTAWRIFATASTSPDRSILPAFRERPAAR